MHDLRFIRAHPDEFDAGLAKRGVEPQAQRIVALDEAHRGALTELQSLQARRNEASKRIGQTKARGEAAEALIAEVAALRDDMQRLDERARALEGEIGTLLASLPNLPDADVPTGEDETANVELRRAGEPRAFNFEPREHDVLGEALGMMDFEAAARLSGSRFTVLSAGLARLERALGAFMLDHHTKAWGYTEVSPPYLVREEAAFGTGNLPKFAHDAFQTTTGLWLIPTAEMPLANLVREQILEEESLPIRLTALTPSFRSEAGAAGRDTRGMIRQHQFMKVELVSITAPESSAEEHERMTACAEEILSCLELPYRVMLLSTGDMSFASRKTYDLEVWLPGQDRYREISSLSNCGDFQARRMDARYRPAGGKGTRFVHTLNGSGLAVGRTLVALLENYQEADGSIAIPDALRPYMDRQETIAAPEPGSAAQADRAKRTSAHGR